MSPKSVRKSSRSTTRGASPTYKLHLDAAQMRVLTRAVELYARLGVGALHDALALCDHLPGYADVHPGASVMLDTLVADLRGREPPACLPAAHKTAHDLHQILCETEPVNAP